MAEDEKNILSVFSSNEKKIGNLYKLYSFEFPAYKKLWNKLAIKKRYSAEVLNDLSLRTDSNGLIETDGNIVQILNYISFFIDQQLLKIFLEKIFFKDALKVALRLERSLKEKKSLELIEPKQKDVNDIFLMLINQTNQNINLLMKTLNKVT